ncbi:MAG: hypothetical protein V3T05_01390, partial [Myxococcota bacterium]
MATLAVAGGLVACQGYDFVFQPNTDREGTHLRFVVEQPSKADILFVIDNSVSMDMEQIALGDSVDMLLAALAPQDTRYRIGIVSTDSLGWSTDCDGNDLIGQNNPGAKGNCDPKENVTLRRPHDGALGRLIAAYDPKIFDVSASIFDTLDATQKTALAKVLPDSLTTHPADFGAFRGLKGEEGARWVIDRETVRLEACQACECTTGTAPDLACDDEAACFSSCAEVIAPKIVEAYFQANVQGLGINGKGWEEGLKSGTLAVGIDATDPVDDTAVAPANDLTRVPDGPNTFTVPDAFGILNQQGWIRDEALLAVMFVSDEEDCSMDVGLWEHRCEYEEGCGAPGPGWIQQPIGSMCYQENVQQFMLAPRRMANLLIRKKGGSVARVAVGFIGGVNKVGVPPLEAREGEAADCVPSAGQPSNSCSCLAGFNLAIVAEQIECNGWCFYTQNQNPNACTTAQDPPACEALAGSRYLRFANRFRRRTFESICLAEGDAGFGEAMADFARIATLACFELEDGVRPAADNPEHIIVRRASKQEADQGIPPSLLPMQDPSSLEAGWYYDVQFNKVCLTGLDRLIGDVY